MVTLLTPTYDAAAQTVTYLVRVIPDDEPENESIVAWYGSSALAHLQVCPSEGTHAACQNTPPRAS